jgi:hypothetical protein
MKILAPGLSLVHHEPDRNCPIGRQESPLTNGSTRQLFIWELELLIIACVRTEFVDEGEPL